MMGDMIIFVYICSGIFVGLLIALYIQDKQKRR